MAEARQRDLKCVKRAGADIAKHDAERGQRQKPWTARMKEFRLILD